MVITIIGRGMRENTEKITKELAENNRLVFFPKNADEVQFIQLKLFSMGYSWAGDCVIKRVKECVSAGLVADKDGFIMNGPFGDTTKETALRCFIDQFDDEYNTHTLQRKISNLSHQELKDLFAYLKEKYPTDFAAAANPVALAQDLAVKPPLSLAKREIEP